jgi:small subunit ribosomal protein S19e
VVRESLQQLEKAGYVKKLRKGRQMTPEGQAYMDSVAYKIRSNMPSEPAAAQQPPAQPEAEPAA